MPKSLFSSIVSRSSLDDFHTAGAGSQPNERAFETQLVSCFMFAMRLRHHFDLPHYSMNSFNRPS